MAVVTEFSIASGAFPLGRALQAAPDARVELERVVPTTGTAVPFFWVVDDAGGAFESAIRAEPDLDDVAVLERIGDDALFKAEWRADHDGLIRGIRETGATVLEASGRGDEWRFQLRFPDGESASAFHSYCLEQEIPVRLDRLYDLRDLRDRTTADLTPEQYDALRSAFEHDYFDEPRGITLRELAVKFDISPQAMSGRLRRAIRKLVSRNLAE